jgi:hypothetical protein
VRELGLRVSLPEALIGLARALLLTGRAAEARAPLEEALGEARAMGAAMQEWNVLYVLANWRRRMGTPQRRKCIGRGRVRSWGLLRGELLR